MKMRLTDILFGGIICMSITMPSYAQNGKKEVVTTVDGSKLEFAVPPQNHYSTIQTYSDGMAKVEISYDSTGFIDKSGALVIRLHQAYNDVGPFHNGLASVGKEVNGKMAYGFINKKGKVVIPFIYDEVENFSNNRAVVFNDHWQMINRRGSTVFGDSQLMIEEHNGQGGYDIEPPAFHSGLMLSRRDHKYGYVDTSGIIKIPFQYKHATAFNEGAALVSLSKSNAKEKRNSHKESKLDKLYNSLPNGPGNSRYHWAFINTKGEIIYQFGGTRRPDLSAGLSEGAIIFRRYKKPDSVGFRSRRYGIINKNGEVIIPAKYGNHLLSFSDNIAIAQVQGEERDNSDGYMLIINKQGKTVGKCSFTTKYGTMYDSKLYFSEGLLSVKIRTKNGRYRWGYINKGGNFVIKPQFETALNFHDGRAVVVTKKGRIAVIKNPLKE